jgi:hypothetical protein
MSIHSEIRKAESGRNKGKMVTHLSFVGDENDIAVQRGERVYFVTPATDRFSGCNLGYAAASNGFPKMFNIPSIEDATILRDMLNVLLDNPDMFTPRGTSTVKAAGSVVGKARGISSQNVPTPAATTRQRTRK